MTLNKTILTRVVKQSQKVIKELDKLKEILEPINDSYYAIDPPSFYLNTDLIPEIKAIMGGELKTSKALLREDSFEAKLVIDGVRFINYFVPNTEKERYEK